MTGPSAEVQARLAKSSRRAALVSALGAVVLFGSLVFSGFKLKALGDDVEEKKNELAALETRKAGLLAEIEKLEKEKKAIEEDKDSLEKQWDVASEYFSEQRQLTLKPSIRTDKRLPLRIVVEPKASAKPLSAGADGRRRYRFSLWLDVPASRAREIKEVDYFFNHPSFEGNRHVVSSDAANNYRVRYDGWGALSRVIITLRLRDGESQQVAFNMHEYVNRVARVGIPGKEIPVKGVPPKDMPIKRPVIVPPYERR